MLTIRVIDIFRAFVFLMKGKKHTQNVAEGK